MKHLHFAATVSGQGHRAVILLESRRRSKFEIWIHGQSVVHCNELVCMLPAFLSHSIRLYDVVSKKACQDNHQFDDMCKQSKKVIRVRDTEW